jgi:hypothetical protein
MPAEHRGTGGAHLGVDGPAGVIRFDGHRLLVDDVAGVGTGTKEHHRIAGIRIPTDYRPVDWGSPTVPGQHRGVEADAATRRDGEKLVTEQSCPTDLDDKVGPERTDTLDLVWAVEVLGAQHRHAVCGRERLQVDKS